METGDTEIASRIASYELAFRMQTAGPELMDFSKESASTLEMYGVNNDTTKQFGTNCLLARRMVERGVRFVMLMHASWDQHTNLNKALKKNCDITDQPTAALIKDLKQRGLLDSTLVVWGGEFGRTPMVEIRNTSIRIMAAGITIRMRTRCGWPVEASSPVRRSARPMTSGSRSPKTLSTFTICRQRCCTASEWITRA